MKDKAKGRILKRSDPRVPPLPTTAQAKQNRRNHAKQVQQAKRQSLIEATRIFNGVDGAPRIVAVIPLGEDVRPKDIVLTFARSVNPGMDEKEENECPDQGIWRIR